MKIEELLRRLDNLELDNKKIALIILVVAALLYVDFSFLLGPQFRALKDTGVKIAKIRADINNLNRDSANIENLKKEAGLREDSLLKVKKVISEGQVPSLLQSISDIANKNNVKIMQIKSSKDLKAKDAKPAKDALKYAAFLINMDLVSGYHNLGAFIASIEAASELMAVEEMRIEADRVNYLQQRANLVLRVYVKK